ncbi:unnamed protein product [Ilex paraguariensis]|uniref:Epidermal patterning factor-like protein n=1 Tax=Ilex paraguariensis TaxID=185542 RepID=A0ABC8UDK0_9AQUA
MKKTICSFLIATLHLVTWVSAASRPFAPYDGGQDPEQILLSPQVAFDTRQGLVSMEEETYEGLSRVGSKPPNCEHKCGGCRPCIAIQVPTIRTNDNLSAKYSNYEPEGWKCNCGTSFSNP